jgi:outer membrane immunogenic protein
MKRVLLAGSGLLALTVAAGAADLPGRYNPVPPRGPVAFVSPIYNWTGFYIGINGGGGWGTSRWDSVGNFDVSGGVIGGTVGYNWQAAQWVLGLEGDIDWSGIRGTTNATCPLGCQTKNTWLSSVRGRIGYSVDRVLPFVTGGLALGDVRGTRSGFAGSTDTNVGWTVGGGLEFVIAGNWTAKAEYLYVDLGKFDCALACGVTAPNNVSFTTHLVRGGVNLRF